MTEHNYVNKYINPQAPFSYIERRRFVLGDPYTRSTYKWINKYWGALPSNIRGVCRDCGKKYQKVKCRIITNSPKPVPFACNCGGTIIKFPKWAIPWKLVDAAWKVKSFSCFSCNHRFISFKVFGAMCNHVSHRMTMCRFCCNSRKEAPEIGNGKTYLETLYGPSDIREIIDSVNPYYNEAEGLRLSTAAMKRRQK